MQRTDPSDTSSIPVIRSSDTMSSDDAAFELKVLALAERPGRVHGLDRVVMLVSLALLCWAMHRADRHAITDQDYSRLRDNQKQRELREANALKRGLRLF